VVVGGLGQQNVAPLNSSPMDSSLSSRARRTAMRPTHTLPLPRKEEVGRACKGASGALTVGTDQEIILAIAVHISTA